MIIRRYSTTSAPDMGPWLIQTSLESRPHVRRLPRPPPLKAVGSLLVRCRQSRPLCLLPACSWVARSVGSTSVRSAPLRMAELRYGGWLRWTSLRSDHRSHAPTLRIRHPPLSFTLSLCTLGRSTKKRYLALLRRAKRLCAVWAKPSALLPSC